MRYCAALTALERILQATHTSGLANARLQCGLTCGRAAWHLDSGVCHDIVFRDGDLTVAEDVLLTRCGSGAVPSPAHIAGSKARCGIVVLRLGMARSEVEIVVGIF